MTTFTPASTSTTTPSTSAYTSTKTAQAPASTPATTRDSPTGTPTTPTLSSTQEPTTSTSTPAQAPDPTAVPQTSAQAQHRGETGDAPRRSVPATPGARFRPPGTEPFSAVLSVRPDRRDAGQPDLRYRPRPGRRGGAEIITARSAVSASNNSALTTEILGPIRHTAARSEAPAG